MRKFLHSFRWSTHSANLLCNLAFHMPYINSYESFQAAIAPLKGKPTVLEALWDGDTEGWYLCLFLYTTSGWWPKSTQRHFLGIIQLGGDIRLFNEQVPPWPEATLAQAIGEKATGQYGLQFYFPSQEPDDDSPCWTDRLLAVACEDCQKLIIPTTSPYLPKEVCYRCHLKRKQNEEISQDQPCPEGVNLFLHQKGNYEHLGYSVRRSIISNSQYTEKIK